MPNQGFVLKILGGIFVVAASFAGTTLILNLLFPSDEAQACLSTTDVTKLTSTTTAKGLHLTYPTAEMGTHGPQLAFDGSTGDNNFWETTTPLPVEFMIEFPQPTILASYALDGGQDSSRMPSRWVIDGTENDQNWIHLDQQKAAHQWKAGESRSFPIELNRPLRQVCFKFQAGFTPGVLRVYEIELH